MNESPQIKKEEKKIRGDEERGIQQARRGQGRCSLVRTTTRDGVFFLTTTTTMTMTTTVRQTVKTASSKRRGGV